MNDRLPGRIGRVRLKSGGELRVLPRGKHHARDHAVAALRDHAVWIEENFDDDLAGYALVCWDHDMRKASMSFVSRDSPVRPWLLPNFVYAELQERRNGDVAREVTEEIVYGWEP